MFLISQTKPGHPRCVIDLYVNHFNKNKKKQQKVYKKSCKNTEIGI